jgi:hypothetical protein
VHAGLPSPTEAFVQGLRVDPGLRRRGAGRQLLEAIEERLRQRGVEVQRAVTAQDNERSRGLAAALGWREVRAVARRRKPPASARGLDSLLAVEAEPIVGKPSAPARGVDGLRLDREAVHEILRRHPVLASRTGAAHFRRVYFAASAAWVAGSLRAGEVVGTGGACAFLDPPDGGGLWLHGLAGPVPSLLGLVDAIGGWGTAAGGVALTVEAPDDADMQGGLDALGFEPAAAHARYLILESRIGSRPPA